MWQPRDEEQGPQGLGGIAGLSTNHQQPEEFVCECVCVCERVSVCVCERVGGEVANRTQVQIQI